MRSEPWCPYYDRISSKLNANMYILKMHLVSCVSAEHQQYMGKCTFVADAFKTLPCRSGK